MIVTLNSKKKENNYSLIVGFHDDMDFFEYFIVSAPKWTRDVKDLIEPCDLVPKQMNILTIVYRITVLMPSPYYGFIPRYIHVVSCYSHMHI